MAEYTRLSKDDLEKLLKHYDLGRLENACPLTGGQANSSFKLTTEKGQFTLSVCDEKTSEEIGTLTRVLACLEAHDFPATRLYPPRAGIKTAFVEFRGKPVYVKEFLDGKVCSELTPFMLQQVGEAMAGLHKIPAPRDLAQAFPYGLKQFDQVLGSGISHPFKPWLKDKKDLLESSLDLTMARGFIHGDIFWDNLLFDGENLAAVLDFEEACQYFLLYDLGMACVGCCTGANGFDPNKIRALITGYQTRRPLSDAEKKQFAAFLVYAATGAAFWRFRQYNLRYPDPDKADNYRELALLADQAVTENFLV